MNIPRGPGNQILIRFFTFHRGWSGKTRVACILYLVRIGSGLYSDLWRTTQSPFRRAARRPQKVGHSPVVLSDSFVPLRVCLTSLGNEHGPNCRCEYTYRDCNSTLEFSHQLRPMRGMDIWWSPSSSERKLCWCKKSCKREISLVCTSILHEMETTSKFNLRLSVPCISVCNARIPSGHQGGKKTKKTPSPSVLPKHLVVLLLVSF